MALPPLPIDPLLPNLLASLAGSPNLVLTADPGAGKTTRVPRAMLAEGLLGDGEAWILEPRRLAARLAASRVAEELGEPLGQRVGYAVRFESKVSKVTRLRYVTEGLLLRRLQAVPDLRGISAVMLDEFHERHLHTDLALTLLRRLQRSARPDLKLLVMSATLDPGPVAAYLAAPILQSEGRAFPVELRHHPRQDDRPLPVQVADAVDRLFQQGLSGHVLVFLPGAAEIRACAKALEDCARRRDLRLFPLHGDLSSEAQQAALAPSDRPKVILSTNVAESSVTLEGISAVVDSGSAREAHHSPWSGLSSLRTIRISQARCLQRTGRAGRTGPGLCVRLFTESEFKARPAFDVPELQRADLAEALLLLHGLGISDPTGLDWFEAPPKEGMEAAERLLHWLGALETSGSLTPEGRKLLALPLHPRLARLVTAAEDLGIPHTGRLGAALLETGDLEARTTLDRNAGQPGPAALSDLLHRLDRFQDAGARGLDPGALHRARQVVRSLEGRNAPRCTEPPDAEDRLRRALLRAYPDRVARRGGGRTFTFLGGGGGRLDEASRVRNADLVVVLEADQQKQGTGGQTLLRAVSTIEPDWLLEDFPDLLRETEELRFNEERDRVERLATLWFGDLSIDETRSLAEAATPGVASVLAIALGRKGLGEDQEPVDHLLLRAAFLARHKPEMNLPDSESLRNTLLTGACQGAASLRDLKGIDWTWALKQALGEEAASLLDAWAPETIQLPKGRPAKIQYEGDTPWIEARLQEFWGLKKCPSIAGGAVPLVLHLLAPNLRAVQVTTDLKGFWERVYKELRPSLSRRYPKHHWPE